MAEMEDVKRGDPLLYILQPKLMEPMKNMQEHYYSQTQEEAEVVQSPEEPISPSNTEILPIEIKVQAPDQASEPERIKESTVSAVDYFRRNAGGAAALTRYNQLRLFNQMTIEEKVEYLMRFPSDQWPYPCEFITESQNYKGVVSDYINGLASIKTFSGEIVTIHLNDLKSIRIIN